MRRLTPPRLLVLIVVVAFLVSLASTDVVAASIVVAGGLAVAAVLRHRSRSASRTALFAVIAAGTGVAVLAALTLPTYRARTHPLVLTTAAHPASTATASALGPTPGGGFTAVGFVAPDDDDSAAGVDRDVAALSTLAATGVTLGPSPDRSSCTAPPTSSPRPTSAAPPASPSCRTTTAPSSTGPGRRPCSTRPRSVTASSPRSPARWPATAGTASCSTSRSSTASARGDYPELVARASAWPSAAARWSSPSRPPPPPPGHGADPALRPARPSAPPLTAIVWMAYDEHGPIAGPGPVAGLPWVRARLATAKRPCRQPSSCSGFPPTGTPGRPRASGEPTSPSPTPQALAAAPGAPVAWDPVSAGMGRHTADGRDALVRRRPQLGRPGPAGG